jgi:hypothetical protein
MIKGVNRSVLVVQTDKSSRFESVYFIIRRGIVSDRSDIIKEANRIIRQGSASGVDRKRVALWCFGVGAISGALAVALVWIISIFIGA